MKKVLTLVLALMMCVSLLAACGGTKDSSSTQPSGGSDLRVAAIFGGAINDGNWNETQYNGLKRIEEAGAEIAYMENVGDTDVATAARTYADEGYDLIYLTTNSYQEYCIPVAEEFPDTMFVSINGTHISDNFISVRIADEEQGFLQGALAALASESGKVGFVGGQEIRPILLGAYGFEQGVEYVNEKYGLNVDPVVINTGNFTDVTLAKETAMSIIEGGADVVCPMANDASSGVLEAAEEKGVMAIAPGLGQDKYAPTATQVIVVKDVSLAYDATFEAFAAGNLKATEVETYGANKGVVYVTDWLQDAPQEVQDRAAEVINALESGEITISTDI